MKSLLTYEENNAHFYADRDDNKKILKHPKNGDFQETVSQAYKKWKNPFHEAYYAFKGELLDLKGLYESLLGRDQVVKFQFAVEAKRRNDQLELEKLS